MESGSYAKGVNVEKCESGNPAVAGPAALGPGAGKVAFGQGDLEVLNGLRRKTGYGRERRSEKARSYRRLCQIKH